MPQASRLTRTLLWISSVCAFTTIIVLAVIFTQVRGFATTSNQTREVNTIAACRSEYRTAIDVAEAAVDDLILSGLVAVAEGREDVLAELTVAAPVARADLARANQSYARAVALSRTDPEAFLAACSERSP